MTTALKPGNVQATLRPRARILILAPEDASVRGLAGALSDRGHAVTCTDDPGEAQAIAHSTDLVLVHRDRADQCPRGAPALVVGADETGGAERQGTRFVGAVDESVPANVVEALGCLAVDSRRWQQRCESLEADLEGIRDGSVLVGCSPPIRRLQGVIRRAADSDATVLIEGRPGTGKSLVARSIHARGRRGDKPMVVVHSGCTDEEALTTALERARGATLLLEDVEQLPQPVQGILVRHLKERSGAERNADAPRILVTTSARLPELVAQGGFREDLFYRLHVFPLVLPELRERREDIPLLVQHFEERYTHQTRSSGFTASAMILLESLPWPGNVAQLENVVRRALGLAGIGPVDRGHLLGPATGLSLPAPEQPTQPESDDEISESSIRPIQEEEQRLLSRALRATKGNVRRAAQLLGIGRATLYRKIQQYKLRMN